MSKKQMRQKTNTHQPRFKKKLKSFIIPQPISKTIRIPLNPKNANLPKKPTQILKPFINSLKAPQKPNIKHNTKNPTKNSRNTRIPDPPSKKEPTNKNPNKNKKRTINKPKNLRAPFKPLITSQILMNTQKRISSLSQKINNSKNPRILLCKNRVSTHSGYY